MISILTPTRKRPEMLMRFIQSAIDTATKPGDLEFILYIEAEDNSYDKLVFPNEVKVKIKQGPRKILSSCYEWEMGKGPIYMMGSDDLIFRTKGWDVEVKKAFEEYIDKIVLVYGHDGDPRPKETSPSPFLHKNWINAVGGYLPPYFTGDFTDTWLFELAEGVERTKRIDIFIEHVHPAFGKRENDETDLIKWDSHWREDMPQKFINTRPEREQDIKKLQNFINSFK